MDSQTKPPEMADEAPLLVQMRDMMRRIKALEDRALPELSASPPPSPAVVALEGMEAGADDGLSEEPLPDALARLVPEGVEHARRIQYLREEWQRLTHKLMSPHVFGEMSEAERIQHQELERYRGLFT